MSPNRPVQEPLHSTESPSSPEQPQHEVLPTLLTSIVLMQPERLVHPPSWVEHIPFAFWLTEALRPRLLVELGTASGNSYAAFAQAVQRLGLATACYAIDTWRGDPQAGFYDEAVFAEWQSYHARRYSAFSSLLRTTFDEAVRQFPDGGIDLLHIDGYHTQEAVTHDFETWLPKMSARGVVLMHDINVRERDFGAWKAWEALHSDYPGFAFLHGHGLGVLAVGSDPPAAIRPLLEPAGVISARTTPVREFFARAGALILAQYHAAAMVTGGQEAGAGRADEPAGAAADRSTRTRPADTPGLSDDDSALEQADLRITALEQERASRQAALVSAQTLALLQASSIESTRRALAGNAARLRAVPAAVASRTIQAEPTARRATLRALGITPRQLRRRPRHLATVGPLIAHSHLLEDAHLVVRSGLFDAAYYRHVAPDAAAAGVNPLVHFLTAGGFEGRAPCLWFDAAWYLAANPDVGAAGVNPLIHYLRAVGHEDRDPHPMFSTPFYRSQLGPERRSVEPLRHYLTAGMFEGRSPHPLFDPAFYTEACGSALTHADPFAHFLIEGATAGIDPHPLFDIACYQSQLAADESTGGNPVLHYLRVGSARGLRSHLLFDPAYYRETNPDVAALGMEPLIHFLATGGREGRKPVPEFDSGWYLATYPDVAKSGINPLLHYLRSGWLEGRNPSPDFDGMAYLARHPDVARRGLNPLSHALASGATDTGVDPPDVEAATSVRTGEPARTQLRPASLGPPPAPARVVVCVTHVKPVAPRAGNEYRIYRMLTWLRRAGYIVIPIVAPLDQSHGSSEDVRTIAAEFGNAIVYHPDGRIEYILRDVPDVLQSLSGELSPRFAARLGENHLRTGHDSDMLRMDQNFCPDALIATLLRLQSGLGRYVLLAEYIWMSRVLPMIGSRALKVIDTIDVFSTRHEKVAQFGIEDLVVEPAAERLRLRRADLLIAIQQNERQALQDLVPGMPVITGGVDFDVSPDPTAPTGRQVLFVASDNPMNRHGLQHFLRFAWPRVRAAVTDAELLVAGGISGSLPLPADGVTALGAVADLAPLYRGCRVVINPAVAGTGVKIKTLEALSHSRRVVTWPNGVDGLSPAATALCRVVADWYTFAEQLIEMLTSDTACVVSAADRNRLEHETSPDVVYAELGRALDDYFNPPPGELLSPPREQP